MLNIYLTYKYFLFTIVKWKWPIYFFQTYKTIMILKVLVTRTRVTAVWRSVNICWSFSHTGASSQTRSFNRCNLGSRWAIEDPKKRKIIRIWCWRWWLHQIRSSCEGLITRGLYSYLIFTQKILNRAKTGVLHGTPKIFLRVSQDVFTMHNTQSTKINRKINFILHGLARRRLSVKNKLASSKLR